MLEAWTVTEGAKGPSSGRRVSAMQRSGYTDITGHQEMRPQQILAAKLSGSWLAPGELTRLAAGTP